MSRESVTESLTATHCFVFLLVILGNYSSDNTVCSSFQNVPNRAMQQLSRLVVTAYSIFSHDLRVMCWGFAIPQHMLASTWADSGRGHTRAKEAS